MSRHSKKNGIPDRWLDYKAVGKRLAGTRFIAFKVPLKHSLNRQLPCPDVFGPWELLDALNQENQELGLIIDLTFTKRYYQPQDVPDSLMCVKIFTAGHEIPSDDTILSFKRAVRRFLQDNADNDKLIGVHCTHGLNRTGYLICRYLIDVDGMDPKEAIDLFNSSRGHDIERQNYLEDLRYGAKRSNVGMEECEQEPRRGQAVNRPLYTPLESGDGDGDGGDREGRRHFNEPWRHRSFSPRESSHRSHHRPLQDGLLPCPPLLSRPPSFHPPAGSSSYHPYRWTPPHHPPPPPSPSPPPPSDSLWRRPSRYEESRSRYLPPEPEWSRSSHLQEDRRHHHPRYSSRWSNESNGYSRPEEEEKEEWAGPKMRHQHRYSHRTRVNQYDHYYQSERNWN